MKKKVIPGKPNITNTCRGGTEMWGKFFSISFFFQNIRENFKRTSLLTISIFFNMFHWNYFYWLTSFLGKSKEFS